MNFDTKHNRFSTNSVKWNVPKDEIAMWVADMDFRCSKAIIDSMQKKLELGIFGYEFVPKAYYEALVFWYKSRHNLSLKANSILFCNGVIPAISSMIRKLSSVNDHIIVQSPIYNVFYSCIENNARKVVENQLLYENSRYEIDFANLEKELSNPKASIMILCNPHNPSGKIYTQKELEKISKLCKKYEVLLISDEIHCDISTQPYTPLAKIDKNSVTVTSPSKAFNIAALHSASIITENEKLRYKIKEAINTDEIAEPNSFAIEASIAAYKHSHKWLDELNLYIEENKNFTKNFLSKNTDLFVSGGEATYLMWIDCESIGNNTDKFCEFLRKKHKLYAQKGSIYRGNGQKFIRLNIATSRETLKEGLKRLENAFKEAKKLA